jgi:hypothetical protein
MSIRRAISIVLLSGSVAAAALAQGSPALNIKFGLWELAVDMGGPGGLPPGIDLSKMTPEQQAAMAQAMRGRGMTPGAGMAVKMCMTKEKLANGQMRQNRPGQDCKDKVNKSTTTTLDITETCTSTTQPPVVTTSELHVEAVSPTNVKMTAQQTGSQPMVVNMTGKWVAAECGDIK